MFSESAGRFIVTVDPDNRQEFESCFEGQACACIGTVSEEQRVVVRGIGDNTIVTVDLGDLKAVWKKPFGELI